MTDTADRGLTGMSAGNLTDQGTIADARRWAAELWDIALPRWLARTGQDRSYREHIIHPLLCSVIGGLRGGGPLNLIEIGCGDGSLLEDRREREMIGDSGRYLGIDRLPELTDAARERFATERIDFMTADVTDRNLAARLSPSGTRWNCAISVLAVQEIPDVESMMSVLAAVLAPGASFVFVSVHPAFGTWLREEGRLDIRKDLSPSGTHSSNTTQWLWAGGYPIVDEPREAFSLPYFHREITSYRDLCARHGFTVRRVIEFPDAAHDIPVLVDKKVSPFSRFEGNLYWPRIAEGPSSLAIVAEKDR
jgi:SAM-dependent methyltransferase